MPSPRPNVLKAPPKALAELLLNTPRGRAWLAPQNPDAAHATWRASHPLLAEIAEWLSAECPDVDGHEAVFLARGPQSGALLTAFVHRALRGQAQGGLRRARYPDTRALLCDGLRLARGMTRKCALAGLWWGGGKGIISPPAEANESDGDLRAQMYCEYGDFISSLNGCYVTAEDSGSAPEDIAHVFSRTRFVTCIPPEFGGRGDPAADTARGVFAGMEAALQFSGKSGGVRGCTITVEGAGRVGAALVEMLAAAGAARIVCTESNTARVNYLQNKWRELCNGKVLSLRQVQSNSPPLCTEAADVFAPCALGGGINPQTIPQIGAKIICGAANNPLAAEARDAEALLRRGIIYAPDYVVNRLGIVRVADESSGRLSPDPAIERHLDAAYEHGIPAVVRRLLAASAQEGISTVHIAAREAEHLSRELHPVYGARGRQLVRAAVSGDWA